jgi:hypothetical protein
MLKRTVALAAVLGLSAAGLLVAGPVATATTKPSVRVACTDGVNPTQLPGPTTKRSVPGPVGSVDRAVNRTEANNGRWEGLLGWSLVNPGEKSQFSRY